MSDGRRLLDDAVAARRRAGVVSGLRGLARASPRAPASSASPDTEVCDLCEGDYRPTGMRTLWLEGLDVPDDLWASFQIPIGLAFFMASTVTSCVVAMYPSPGGATESELHFETWSRMRDLNPVLDGLEPDIEGLIANRLVDPPMYVIAPIDRCYELTGTIKAHWEGISGGPGVEAAVSDFFEALRARAVPA